MKRKDEEIAKTEFDTLLRTNMGIGNIAWNEVQQIDEPPDFYLLIDRERYAVEVTSVFDEIEVNDMGLPSIAISASISKLVNDVEREAKLKFWLQGGYLVAIEPLENFTSIKEHLKRSMLRYIQQTQSLSNANKYYLLGEDVNDGVYIQKINSGKNYVGEAISFPAKWEGESLEELSILIERVLENKIKKLANVKEPKILLIWDAFNYLKDSHWKRLLQKASQKTFFHTICRISPSTKSSIIYSVYAEWII